MLGFVPVSVESQTMTDVLTTSGEVLVFPEGGNVELQSRLARLRELAYARYTVDGKPAPIMPANDGAGLTRRLVVKMLGRGVYALRDVPENLAQHKEELSEMLSIGGYFCLEKEELGQTTGRIEARELMRWSGWPEGKRIGYFSEFTPHPLLPREYQQEVLKELLERAFKVAETEEFLDDMFVIMADHVVRFVEKTGVGLEPQPGAALNRENPRAKRVFDAFPRYWDCQPGLYKFVPRSKMVRSYAE